MQASAPEAEEPKESAEVKQEAKPEKIKSEHQREVNSEIDKMADQFRHHDDQETAEPKPEPVKEEV